MKSCLLGATTAALLFVSNATFGQGSLTPPGLPGPTMKTLQQIEPRTPISAVPFTITNSGSFYLTDSLTGVSGQNGITIQANNVTVDLNGFALIGVPGSSNGIAMSGNRTNISIRNGHIQSWGGDGISPVLDELWSPLWPANSHITQIQASHNGGFGIGVGGNCLVESCVSDSNGTDGILTGPNSIVTRCSSRQNGQIGIKALYHTVITDCTAANNGSDGFATGDVGVIQNCTATANGGHGFSISDGTIADCVAVANAGYGIDTSGVVRDCYAEHNLGGILAGFQSNISGCKARANSQFGIKSFFETTIQNCSVLQNYTNGIIVGSSCMVLNNQISESGNGLEGGGAGILVQDYNNRIEGNHVVRNTGGIGIKVVGTNNLIFKNTAAGNFENFNIAVGNVVGTIVTNQASMNSPTNSCYINIGF